MKIGIILIFHNNEKDINKRLFLNLLSHTKKTPLCFVNNGSKDNTFESLKSLKSELESDVTIIDIKRNKGDESAIKAGARYLFNTVDLKHIGYINMNIFNCFKDIDKLFMAIEDNKDLIVQYNIENMGNKNSQRTLFKNIFSVIDYLEFLNLEYESSKINFTVS